MGRTEEGIAAYRKSVTLDPALGQSRFSLSNLKTFTFADAELAQMEQPDRRQGFGQPARA